MNKERVLRNLISALVFMAMFWGIAGSMKLRISLPVILASGVVYFLFYTGLDWYRARRKRTPAPKQPGEE